MQVIPKQINPNRDDIDANTTINSETKSTEKKERYLKSKKSSSPSRHKLKITNKTEVKMFPKIEINKRKVNKEEDNSTPTEKKMRFDDITLSYSQHKANPVERLKIVDTETNRDYKIVSAVNSSNTSQIKKRKKMETKYNEQEGVESSVEDDSSDCEITRIVRKKVNTKLEAVEKYDDDDDFAPPKKILRTFRVEDSDSSDSEAGITRIVRKKVNRKVEAVEKYDDDDDDFAHPKKILRTFRVEDSDSSDSEAGITRIVRKKVNRKVEAVEKYDDDDDFAPPKKRLRTFRVEDSDSSDSEAGITGIIRKNVNRNVEAVESDDDLTLPNTKRRTFRVEESDSSGDEGGLNLDNLTDDSNNKKKPKSR